MKRQRNKTLEQLRQTVLRLDSESIDRLYGLEPLWEPGAQPRLAPEEFLAVRCPYCGERLDVRVDLTAQEDSYIEDCQVCCRPIEFQVEREESGALAALGVRRLD
jgi:Cysteine-rich CPXCG